MTSTSRSRAAPVSAPSGDRAGWRSVTGPPRVSAAWVSVTGPPRAPAGWLSVTGPPRAPAGWLSVTGPPRVPARPSALRGELGLGRRRGRGRRRRGQRRRGRDDRQRAVVHLPILRVDLDVQALRGHALAVIELRADDLDPRLGTWQRSPVEPEDEIALDSLVPAQVRQHIRGDAVGHGKLDERGSGAPGLAREDGKRPLALPGGHEHVVADGELVTDLEPQQPPQ